MKTFDETVLRLSGATASPRKWYIAIRPCIAATEASAKTPVHVTGRVHAGRGGAGDPVGPDVPGVLELDPGLLQAHARGVRDGADRHRGSACR